MKMFPSWMCAILEVVVLAVIYCSLVLVRTLVDILAGKQANITLFARELLHILLILEENHCSRLLVVGGTSIWTGNV